MTIPEKILIDTNIVIGLEDHKAVQSHYSQLNRACGENGIQIFIHESSYKDIEQDNDDERRKISLSKLAKYPRINRSQRSTQQKENDFGEIKKHNDEVDTDLLVSLSTGVVDLIVTEDQGIHKRVRDNTELSTKVMTVEQALALLDEHFGITNVDYKHIREMACDQLHHDDPFFDSLKADYGETEFINWFEKCMRQQRRCWVIQDGEKIAGLAIRNDEQNEEELKTLGVPGKKVLKICMLKTDESISGEKFGEQLLKTALDFAYRNNYDSTFLTLYPKQAGLIRLIGRFGFLKANDKGEEAVYYKHTQVVQGFEEVSPLDFHKLFWPCIRKTGVDVYLVPIQPEFHARLFPEAHDRLVEQMAFDFDGKSRTPGNAIRKIYVCNSKTKHINEGSILLFYRTGGDSVITSVGILEEYIEADNHEALIKIASGRSVYSHDELAEKVGGPTSAKAVNFYYAENFDEHITIEQLTDKDIITRSPQSIMLLEREKFDLLYNELISDPDKGIFYD